MIQAAVFCVVTPCSDVGYQRFGETCCLHLQGENGGSPSIVSDTDPFYSDANHGLV
jgi:hypothetical protein